MGIPDWQDQDKPQYFIEVKKNTIMYCKLGPFPLEIICSQAMTTVPEFVSAIEEGNFRKTHEVIDKKGVRFNTQAPKEENGNSAGDATAAAAKRHAKPPPAGREQDKTKKKKKKRRSRDNKNKKAKRKRTLAKLDSRTGETAEEENALAAASTDAASAASASSRRRRRNCKRKRKKKKREQLKGAVVAVEVAVGGEAKKKKKKQKKQAFEDAYAALDQDGDGELSLVEFLAVCGWEEGGDAATRSAIQNLFERLDTDRGGTVCVREMASAMKFDKEARAMARLYPSLHTFVTLSESRRGKKRGKKRRASKLKRRGTALKPIPTQSNFLGMATQGPTLSQATHGRLQQRRNSVAERLAFFKQREAMREAAAAAKAAKSDATPKELTPAEQARAEAERRRAEFERRMKQQNAGAAAGTRTRRPSLARRGSTGASRRVRPSLTRRGSTGSRRRPPAAAAAAADDDDMEVDFG